MPGKQNFLASGYRAITVMPMLRGETAIGAISVVAQPAAALLRQAARAAAHLRQPGRHRHREYPAVQGTARAHRRSLRVAAAADRHRRRAQGHQPLDLRSADGARDARRIGCAAVRCRQGQHHAARRTRSSIAPKPTATLAEFMEYVKNIPIKAERGIRVRTRAARRAGGSYPRRKGRPGIHSGRRTETRRLPHGLGVPMLREGVSDRRPYSDALGGAPFTDKQIELVSTFADQAAIAIENVRLFDEIQEKSRQLEEASKHKSQFLANMSHELRTPLNAILGYTELIADGVYGETPEKVQATLKRVITNGKHLLGLINDVLDLSKIEAGQLTLSLGDYSMKDVVHNVYGAVEPLAVGEEAHLQGRDRARPARRPRRRAPADAGAAQSGRQFDQVHRRRQRHHPGVAQGRHVLRRRARHRARNFRGRPEEAVPGIPAGRQFDHQEEGRHRPRARHLQAHHRDARRPHLGRIAGSARARPSPSRFRCARNRQRGRHEQDDSGGRGPGGQSADPARSAGQRRLRDDRSRERRGRA